MNVEDEADDVRIRAIEFDLNGETFSSLGDIPECRGRAIREHLDRRGTSWPAPNGRPDP